MSEAVYKLGAVLTLKDVASSMWSRATGNAEKYKSRLSEIQGATELYEKSWKRIKTGGIMTATGLGVASAIKATIGPASSFEQSLALLKGTSKATASDMKLLENAALEAGLATQFSPDQAVEGLTALASVGQNAQQAMSTLRDTLDLTTAANGALDMATSARLVATEMDVFGVSSKKATDTFVRMSQLSSFRLEELEGAFRGVNGVAPVANQGLATTSSVMMALKAGGETSVGAGEKLRMALQSLMTPSKNASKAMSALGIKVRDGNGEMRNIIDIFHDVNLATKKMTSAQRDANIASLFGAEGMKAYNLAMRAKKEITVDGVKSTLKGIQVLRYYQNELSNVNGETKNFAGAQLDTFQGQSNLLGGTLTTIKLVFGKTLLPALKTGVSLLNSMLTPILAFTQTHPKITKYASAIISLGSAFLILSGAVKILRGGLGLYRTAQMAANLATKGSNAVVKKSILLKGLATLKTGALKTAIWLKNTAVSVSTALLNSNIVSMAKSGAIATFSAIKTGLLTSATWAMNAATKAATVGIKLMRLAFLATPVSWIVAGIGLVIAAGVALYKNWDKVKKFASKMWIGIKKIFSGLGKWFSGLFSSLWKKIKGFFSKIGDAWRAVKSWFTGDDGERKKTGSGALGFSHEKVIGSNLNRVSRKYNRRLQTSSKKISMNKNTNVRIDSVVKNMNVKNKRKLPMAEIEKHLQREIERGEATD